jgi:hypothetical protein
MQNLRDKLIAGGAVLILAGIGTMMNRQAAQAAGAPVNIESPLPLPVTGTVSATLTGTPNVNVANPATAPALFLNVNDPGRIPYQATQSASSCSATVCAAAFPAVPSGHRLVVQHFSGAAGFSSQPTSVSATLTIANSTTMPTLSTFFVPASVSQSFFDQPVLVYYDAVQMPDVQLGWTMGPLATFASFTLTGYLVDCTIAPCAAIAH